MNLKVAYVGMTHLGLVSAIGAAEKGYRVVCFDLDKDHVVNLQNKKLSFVEPDLAELLEKNIDHIEFTHNILKVNECDLIYVSCDVPTNNSAQSDLSQIKELFHCISQAVSKDKILLILSQVPPGFTRQLPWDKSKLFYQVETLIFGKAVKRTLYPERFMIGTQDSEMILPSTLLRFLQTFDCPVFSMRYESAELCKIAINMFLVSSITTANVIAELCEKIGADFSEIEPCLRLDKRIGKHAYLSPGLGIAGGNLERDLTTFCMLAEKHGTDAGIIRAWQFNSEYRSDWVLRQIHQKILPHKKNPRLAILGLTYKKDTSSLKNSPALKLIENLKKFSIYAFDPVIKSLAHCPENLKIVSSAKKAYEKADALLVMTPWNVFQKISSREIASRLDGKIIIDPYGIFDQTECQAVGLNYYKIGV